MGTGTKRPGREVNHSPPSSDEVKNEWSYVSTPPIRLHGVDRENVPLKKKIKPDAASDIRQITHPRRF